MMVSMLATEAKRFTLEEFHHRYGAEKPYYEYWAGEAVQKAMPTSRHGRITKILLQLLDGIGYDSGAEITLRLDPNYELIPDVIAVEGEIEEPYPTAPFEVVIEVLSPADLFSRVLRKCRLYEKWGIRRILVVDPAARVVWSFEGGAPVETDVIAQRGDRTIRVEELWEKVDRKPPSLMP
jgi:Uma2 family endonuclease